MGKHGDRRDVFRVASGEKKNRARTAESRSGQLVEKEIKGGNPAVPGNDEISPGVSWRLTRAARYPLDPPAIAQFLGLGNWLIPKVRVSSPDRARDAIDLVAATVDATTGVVEHAIFGEDLVDGRAPTRGVIFTEDVVKIAGQQGRYAVGHGLSPFGTENPAPATINDEGLARSTLTNLRVRNYRCLADVELPREGLTAFVGDNG